jgi:glycosyltransferase involved in cell wall biosynthesis
MSSVDVIVPCYRYAHYLRECVSSVLGQSVKQLRVLIIDDASPDNTAEVAAELAKEDSRVTVIRHSTNKGHIATYNEGIEWVSADYMLLLSADDYLLPGALRRAVNLMDVSSDVGLTFGKAIVRHDRDRAGDMHGIDRSEDYRILSGLEFIELSGASNIVPTAAAVVRTALQKRLGGYRPELPHSGDMEMWLRFAAHGSVGMFEAHQAVYRRHDGNMSAPYLSRSGLQDLLQRKAAFDCFFETCGPAVPNSSQLRFRLFRLLGREAIGFASAAFNEGEMEVSEQLSTFALAVCPQVERSLPWIRLAGKRSLGLRRWRALRPAVARIRQAMFS